MKEMLGSMKEDSKAVIERDLQRFELERKRSDVEQRFFEMMTYALWPPRVLRASSCFSGPGRIAYNCH